MFARVSMYEVPIERTSEASEGFQQAIDEIRAIQGLVEAYLLVSSESGRVLTITLWDSVATMESSRVAASRLRSEAMHAVDGSVVSTQEYEVTGHQLGLMAPGLN